MQSFTQACKFSAPLLGSWSAELVARWLIVAVVRSASRGGIALDSRPRMSLESASSSLNVSGGLGYDTRGFKTTAGKSQISSPGEQLREDS